MVLNAIYVVYLYERKSKDIELINFFCENTILKFMKFSMLYQNTTEVLYIIRTIIVDDIRHT